MKSKVTVPAEIIKNIQRDFDLDNTELATLFGVSLRTVQSWLKKESAANVETALRWSICC